MVVGEVVWTAASDVTGMESAIVSGREVRQKVNVLVYCYRMVCSCGRFRYAKPNTLHEVTLCRVCQREERLRRRREKKV